MNKQSHLMIKVLGIFTLTLNSIASHAAVPGCNVNGVHRAPPSFVSPVCNAIVRNPAECRQGYALDEEFRYCSYPCAFTGVYHTIDKKPCYGVPLTRNKKNRQVTSWRCRAPVVGAGTPPLCD